MLRHTMKLGASHLRLCTALAVTLLVGAVTASTAIAHYSEIDRHYGKGYVDSSHSHIYVCDKKPDGYRVKVQYTLYGNVRQVVDQDGAGGYCWHGDLPGGGYAGSFRLCKVNVGCSGWKAY